MRPGPLNLITDVAGLRVGQAQDETIRSGVTVVTGDAPFVAACHVAGGAPGTRETDLLSPVSLVQEVDAIVLSGGSAWGLASADGVMAALRDAGRGLDVRGNLVPIVPAAIVFDLAGGGAPLGPDTPYPALGRAAWQAAAVRFPLGSVGAGTGATTSLHKGGIGSASAVLPDGATDGATDGAAGGATVGAITVVNAVGQATATGSRHFLAAPWEEGEEFGGLGCAPRAGDPAPTKVEARAATVISVVATDRALTRVQAGRMAAMARDGIARAIQPSHTPFDGDIVFAVATGRGGPATDLDLIALGHAAATCLARAVARGVYHATPRPGDPRPAWSSLAG